MFSIPANTTPAQLNVSVVTADAVLGRRVKAALEVSRRLLVELSSASIASAEAELVRSAASLHVIETDPGKPSEIAALERFLETRTGAAPVIVLSKGLAETDARRLLKLRIADWLPSGCTDAELVTACEQVMRPAKAGGAPTQARCTAFMAAAGGAGATTLSLAATSALFGKGRDALARCCVVDLDFQRSALAEYLDITPNLQLAEVRNRPDRLDRHLFEVMLSRHASGLAVLAAPPSLDGAQTVSAELIGRLLDLAAVEFDQVVIDLPSQWQPWCEHVVRGADAVYIVTDLTVNGLRQARRLAGMLKCGFDVEVNASVIVNKRPWMGSGVSRQQAGEALGPLLAGYVSDCRQLIRDAQNRGVMLAQVQRNNRVANDLGGILARPLTRAARREPT